jgi:hypothetical protein
MTSQKIRPRIVALGIKQQQVGDNMSCRMAKVVY